MTLLSGALGSAARIAVSDMWNLWIVDEVVSGGKVVVIVRYTDMARTFEFVLFRSVQI